MNKVFKEPIRVLQIGMHDQIGGVETYLMNYYRNINKDNIQFDFINPYKSLCFEEEIIKLGGKIYNVPNFKKNPIGYYNSLKKIIRENNYQIVHINLLSSANILPIIAAHNCHVNHVIAHSHNNDTPSGLLRKIMHSLNKKILIKYATDYFACSDLAGKWMFNNQTFTVINNAIDLTIFYKDDNIRKKIRQELSIDNKFVIGHVGRFSYQKNHEFLINVFYEVQKDLPACTLLLIGTGELENTIKDNVMKLGISDKVIFLGTTNQVNDYLNAMDIFVLPSRFEGLGIVAIEAQAVELPCLLSEHAPNEAKITEPVKFLSIDNYELWVNEIKKDFKNKNKNLGSKLFPKTYDIKYASTKLENIYKDMYL